MIGTYEKLSQLIQGSSMADTGWNDSRFSIILSNVTTQEV